MANTIPFSFRGALLSGWCVSNLSEPDDFSIGSALTSANSPLWGKEFTIALTSGSQSQTVTATTAITPIQYTVSSICTTTLSILKTEQEM